MIEQLDLLPMLAPPDRGHDASATPAGSTPGRQLPTREELRDDGIRRAVAHADAVEPTWSDRALEALRVWCAARRGADFLLEEARKALEPDLPTPPDKRAWGGVIRRAAFAGLVRKVGYGHAADPKVHCSINTLWRAL